MTTSTNFKNFLDNIAIDNTDIISMRYEELTRALNLNFRNTDSKIANSLQVGSYGRKTAIKGISDLDMLYIMPSTSWEAYKSGGQAKLLSAAAKAMSERYPTTTIKVDRLVVRVLYQRFHVEVQPVFADAHGGFIYPDTYNGGKWKTTKPKQEIEAIGRVDADKNYNLRCLCKMARSWNNKHGVAMGGLLIDTLAHNFLISTEDYDDRSYSYFGWMMRDFLKYLSELQEQDRFNALGSGQHVKVKRSFKRKAKKSYDIAVEACETEGTDLSNEKWRAVFGRGFPTTSGKVAKAMVLEADGYKAENTEEFVEDRFGVDIRFPLRIECEVDQKGFRPRLLREMYRLGLWIPAARSLRFYIARNDVPEPHRIYWKVLNRGPRAIRKGKIRGQIVMDAGKGETTETTSFYGDHIVECYVVVNDVVLATDRIHVRIEDEES